MKGPIKDRIMQLLVTRGPKKTICPSEILPRSLKQSKLAMAKVRTVAARLHREGKIIITRGGKPVSVDSKGPIRLGLATKATAFDYTLNFKKLNFRKHPELYRVGKGEQGVLLVEPYKSEILPNWRFKTPEMAQVSAKKIYSLFLAYGLKKDFVGMDMARKFLQMGYTRSRRYANHRSGKKYLGSVPQNKRGQSGAHGRPIMATAPDNLKAQSARIFAQYLAKANKNRVYRAWRKKRACEVY